MITDNHWLICEALPAIDGAIGVITLNRPEAFNALNAVMIEGMDHQLRAWALDPMIIAVVIKSASSRAFSAGGDIRALYQNGRENPEASRQFFQAEYRLNYLLGSYNKPVIALIDGIVMGGGAGISMHGSHCVGTENTLFAMPETAIGLYPDVGASHFLQKCPGLLSYYLALSGARLHIADCCYAGLISDFVPSNQLPELLSALCTTPLPGDAWQAISQLIAEFSIEADTAPLQEHQFLIDGMFAGDSVDQILRFLESDDSQWSKAVASHLQQKSPLSLTITLEAFKRARGKSLQACLQQDYLLVQHFLQSHDLYEGIRAVIIDKDMQAKWQPARLSDISDNEINAYFDARDKEPLQFPG